MADCETAEGKETKAAALHCTDWCLLLCQSPNIAKYLEMTLQSATNVQRRTYRNRPVFIYRWKSLLE